MPNLVTPHKIFTLVIIGIVSLLIQLATASPVSAKPTQLKGYTTQYFSGVKMSNLLLVKQEPAINFDWKKSSPAPSIPSDYFSARFLANLKPAHSKGIKEYTFYVTANDYVRFSLNGHIIIEHWSDSGQHTYTGRFSLEATQTYDLVLEYAEGYGSALVKLEWESDTQPRSIIGSQYSSFTDTNTDSTRDSDQDGIPDFWEIQQGINPLDSIDAYSDKNQNGIINIDEYNNQTNWGSEKPVAKLSNIQQEAIIVKGSSLTASWATPTHRIDNTKLTTQEISGYIVSYIKDGGTPVQVTIRGAYQNNYTFKYLKPGYYVFYIQAIDLYDLRSPFSIQLPVIMK